MSYTSSTLSSSRAASPLYTWALLVLLALVWGSSFFLIKKALVVYTTTEVAAGRVFLAFLFFSPVLYRTRHQVAKPLWPYLILAGFLGYFIPAFLIAEAGRHIESAIAGTLNALSPMFTMIIGGLFFQQRTRSMQVVGVLVALAGALLLILTRSSSGGSLALINPYVLLAVLATLCYGTNINLVARHISHLPAVVSTAWIFLGAGPLAGAILTQTHFFEKMATPANLYPSLGLLSLGVLASGLMSVLFNRLIQLSSAVFASSVTYLMPIVALAWGVLDHEHISAQQWAGTAVILAGVYLINSKKSLSKKRQ